MRVTRLVISIEAYVQLCFQIRERRIPGKGVVRILVTADFQYKTAAEATIVSALNLEHLRFYLSGTPPQELSELTSPPNRAYPL